ncbi:hypothetical protein L7F22_015411 [Adiantum nelumboides]|nr:hypothetical protein [Adiantum nelumboides]
MSQTPPTDYTYLMVENPLSHSGASSMQEQLQLQSVRVATLEKEMADIKKQLNPLYGMHCLSSREVIAFNLALTTVKLLDKQLTWVIRRRYRRSPNDTHQERQRKERRFKRMDRFKIGKKHSLYSYLILLKHRRDRHDFRSLLEEAEETFLEDRYDLTSEEARARVDTCVRQPFLRFTSLRFHRNLSCHLFEKFSQEAKTAQLAVLEDILTAIGEGWLRNTRTEPIIPLLELESRKRKEELQRPPQA